MANIVLAVCGGIAAYKSCDLARLIHADGHQVRVAMTDSASRFVTPMTFQALTGNPVFSDLFVLPTGEIDHVGWAEWCDLFVVAPLTATTLAAMTWGFAANPVTCLALALPPEKDILLAPAMNTQMWFHPQVQENIQKISSLPLRGWKGRVEVVDPRRGELACGTVGEGAMALPETILERIRQLAGPSQQHT